MILIRRPNSFLTLYKNFVSSSPWQKIHNLEATSVDFYATIRSLYLERRNRMIRNQSADEQDPFQEFDIE